jgi:hypothetical protein
MLDDEFLGFIVFFGGLLTWGMGYITAYILHFM